MSKKHLDFKPMLDDTDFSDPSSIERYAANLDGMTFRDILELGIAPEGESAPKDFGSKKYKGGTGTLIEERYFGYKANSDDRPDFPEAGVELKATCFDVLKNGRKSAGERLVLTMIPYDRPVSLDYDSSHLKTKLSNILLIYYGRDRSIDKYDQRIERAVMVRLPEEDMKIIRADYEKIISYIQDGRADELSEGMTTYLGACTKGATSIPIRVRLSAIAQSVAPFPLSARIWTMCSTLMSSVLRESGRALFKTMASLSISKVTQLDLSSNTMAKLIARLRSSTAWNTQETRRNGRHSFIACSA